VLNRIGKADFDQCNRIMTGLVIEGTSRCNLLTKFERFLAIGKYLDQANRFTSNTATTVATG
jgi:hypothetical protein